MDLEQNQQKLNALFKTLLGNDNVYFQPPDNLVMNYPCIVYNREKPDAQFANNKLYLYRERYQVTLMDRDPNSPTIYKIASLPLTSQDRWFASDNLNHYVFTLYF